MDWTAGAKRMENGKKEYKRKDFYTASLIYSGYIVMSCRKRLTA